VIPESLGNDDLTLSGHVCDACQKYFGKEVEQFVLNKTPIAAWRVLLGTTTKKGKPPHSDLSQPNRSRGRFPSVSEHHDNFGLRANEDGYSCAIELNSDQVNQVLDSDQLRLKVVLSPKVLFMMGRFLCKIGMELICTVDPEEARSSRFDLARRYAREGSTNWLWPILMYSAGDYHGLKKWGRDEDGYYITSECYSFLLGDVERNRFLEFGIGTDRYIITLDEPQSEVIAAAAVQDHRCRLLWYHPSEIWPKGTH